MDLIGYTATAILPVFFVIFIGALLNRLHFFSEITKDEIVKLVFYVGTPCLIFKSVSASDFSQTFDGNFLIFCGVIVLVQIAIFTFACQFIKNPKIKGAVIQIGYRSNFAIAGMPLAMNLMDASGVALTSVTLSFVVIFYNVSAVILLSYYGSGKKSAWEVFISVLKNPLIIGTFLGMCWAIFRLPLPAVAVKSISYLADIASCMGLLMIGASISFSGLRNGRRYILLASFFRNIFAPVFVLTSAVLCGYRGNYLTILAIMSATPAAVNCFSMSKQMGVDAQISAYGVSITSLVSIISIFVSIYVIKYFGLA